MSEATITIPPESVHRFRDALRIEAAKYAKNFAEFVETWSENDNEGSREDVGSEIHRATEALRLADSIGDQDGPLEVTGDAWVLSDTADKLLVQLLEEAKDAAGEAPCEYGEVAALAGRIESWSKVCEQADATYRRLDTKGPEAAA